MDLAELFLRILNMSVTAGFAVLVVLAARLALRKAPRKYQCWLWYVPLFRLLCPWSFSAGFSLLGVLDTPVVNSRMEYIPLALEQNTASMPVRSGTVQEAVSSALLQEAERLAADPLEVVSSVGAVIWLIGVLFLLGWGVLSMLRLRYRLRTAVFVEPGLWQTDIPTAFVWGYLCPGVYLPFGLSETEEKLVLQHERAHIERNDQFLRLFVYFALCLHWFNPLVWVMFRLSSRDVELACDEHVLTHVQEDVRADYAQALLHQAGGRALPFSPLSFGTGDVRMRVQSILKFENKTSWLAVAALFMVTVLGLSLTANPINDRSNALFGSLYSSLDRNRNVWTPTDSFYCSLEDGAPDYAVAKSGRLYETEESYLSGRGWKLVGQLEAYEAKEDDFRQWFPQGLDEQTQQEAERFRRSNYQIWAADLAEGQDYLLFRQKDGTDWLAWCSLDGETPRIEQLFPLTRIEGTYIHPEYIGLPVNRYPSRNFFEEYAMVDIRDTIVDELGELPEDLKITSGLPNSSIRKVCRLYRFESASYGIWGVVQYRLEGENGEFYDREEEWTFHDIARWSLEDAGPHAVEILVMEDTFHQKTQTFEVSYTPQ